MQRLLIDTTAWMAMTNAGDPQHAACCQTRDNWLEDRASFITTDYIVDEALTLIRMRLGLTVAAKWWEQVEQSTRLRWEWIDPVRAEKTRQWRHRWLRSCRGRPPTLAWNPRVLPQCIAKELSRDVAFPSC